jgi:hypothetical protein
MGPPMSCKFTLDLAAGGRIDIELPLPGRVPSSYFVFMPESGRQWIWPLVRSILYTAGQPVCDFLEVLRRNQLEEQDITRSSLSHLLHSEGYAFNVAWNPASLPIELDEGGRTTFLFVRDPRESVADLQARSDTGPVSELIRSSAVGNLSRRYRRLADFCRARRHVKIVRLEDLADSWTRLVSDILETLGLNVPQEVTLRIVGNIDTAPHPTLKSSYRERFDRCNRTVLDNKFADVLPFFGYLPEDERLSLAGAGAPAPTATPLSAGRGSDSQSSLSEGDPGLCWRLRRNGKQQTTVLGRRVTMETDDYGCRPVFGQPSAGEKTLAVYGCSFTYGTALPFEETFCSVLQSLLPRWRVENYGTGGYSTAQNLIQLRRNSRWGRADYVTFCYLPDHRLRNVADISFRRKLMAKLPRTFPQRPYPRAALARDGSLEFRYVNHPRWDLEGIDLSDFEHDAYYLDLIAASIFERAGQIVKRSGGHFFVTTLRGKIWPIPSRRLEDAGIPILNASIEGREYTCLPDDPHPNALANHFYAQRIRDYLVAREAPSGAVASSSVKPPPA